MAVTDRHLESPEQSNPHLVSVETGEFAGGVFSPLETPDYGVYDRDRFVEKVIRIADALGDQVDPAEVELTLATGHRFYDQHEGKEEVQEGSFAFVVPARISRESGSTYFEDWTPYMPLMRYLNGNDAVHLAAGLPPGVIEPYHPDESGRRGYVVLAPIFGDMAEDLGRSSALRLSRRIIDDAATFARDRLHTDIIGLGATIPALTKYGETIKEQDPTLTTTTGHGGTVWLIGETVSKAIEVADVSPDTIGIIGVAGSIGRSALYLLREQYPNAQFLVSDARFTSNLAPELRGLENVVLAESNQEVLEQSDATVSAVTSTIDVTGINLEGKVIVDDSQPAGFDRAQVEAHGGKVIWVAGKDNSADKHTTRLGGYRAGLAQEGDVWGCEAEVSSIWATGELESVITSAVTPESARRIGKLFARNDIEVTDFQSFGSKVEL